MVSFIYLTLTLRLMCWLLPLVCISQLFHTRYRMVHFCYLLCFPSQHSINADVSKCLWWSLSIFVSVAVFLCVTLLLPLVSIGCLSLYNCRLCTVCLIPRYSSNRLSLLAFLLLPWIISFQHHVLMVSIYTSLCSSVHF